MPHLHIRHVAREELCQLLDLYEHLHEEGDVALPRDHRLGALWESILANAMLRCIVGAPSPLLLAVMGLVILAASFGIFVMSWLKDTKQAGVVIGGVMTVLESALLPVGIMTADGIVLFALAA